MSSPDFFFFQMAELVEGLITEGADVSARDPKDRSCLHIVVQRKNTKLSHIVRILLQNGAEAEVFDEDNQLPVELALKEGDDDISALLLQYMSPPV